MRWYVTFGDRYADLRLVPAKDESWRPRVIQRRLWVDCVPPSSAKPSRRRETCLLGRVTDARVHPSLVASRSRRHLCKESVAIEQYLRPIKRNSWAHHFIAKSGRITALSIEFSGDRANSVKGNYFRRRWSLSFLWSHFCSVNYWLDFLLPITVLSCLRSQHPASFLCLIEEATIVIGEINVALIRCDETTSIIVIITGL